MGCLCVHVRLWGSDMNKSILAWEQVCTKCCEGTKEGTITVVRGGEGFQSRKHLH